MNQKEKVKLSEEQNESLKFYIKNQLHLKLTEVFGV